MKFNVDLYASPPSDTNKQKYTNTYNMLRNFITEQSSTFNDEDISVYLQGSYANSTHINADSDVDIVVECNSIWRRDISKLLPFEKEKYLSAVSTSELTLSDFRQQIYNQLVGRFGATYGNKSIKIEGNSYRMNVDIIPCFQYRKYESLEKYSAGIVSIDKTGESFYSYPKSHIKSCEIKNKNTSGNYKALVRAYKRLIPKFDSSLCLTSYRIENLIYNIHDSSLIGELNNVFSESLNLLCNNKYSNRELTCADQISKISLSSYDQQVISLLREDVQ